MFLVLGGGTCNRVDCLVEYLHVASCHAFEEVIFAAENVVSCFGGTGTVVVGWAKMFHVFNQHLYSAVSVQASVFFVVTFGKLSI